MARCGAWHGKTVTSARPRQRSGCARGASSSPNTPYDYVDHGGTAESARQLGVDEHAVVKTLVMQDERAQPLIVLIHGDCQVSTKNLAREIGAKSVEPCKPEVAQRHSGYLVGGTSPFGLRKAMPCRAVGTGLAAHPHQRWAPRFPGGVGAHGPDRGAGRQACGLRAGGAAAMTTIALLEDEAGLREEVADFLESCGHRVLQAGTLAEFAALVTQARIVVLDVMLPDGSGFDAVRQVRSASRRTGIVMLTALGELQDRLTGLNEGADHYLVKPFRLLELEAVIESLLRRIGREWVFDAGNATLLDQLGHSLSLTDQEAAFVRVLARARGAVISRREVVDALGQEWASYDMRRLDTLVSRLRSRWQRSCGRDLPLRTLHREGYGFGETIDQA